MSKLTEMQADNITRIKARRGGYGSTALLCPEKVVPVKREVQELIEAYKLHEGYAKSILRGYASCTMPPHGQF